jgi:crossover junction endodeoxyribonuclease RuvC
MSNYIGLDLSTKTGFVAMNEYDVLFEEKEILAKGNGVQRMSDYINVIVNRICQYQNPIVGIEGFSFGSRGSGVDFQYGLGWGIRTRLYALGIKYYDIPPSCVKKFASGKGNSDKRALAVAVKERWNYFHSSDNVTDAFILAQMVKSMNESKTLPKFQQEAILKVSEGF